MRQKLILFLLRLLLRFITTKVDAPATLNVTVEV